jgi:hypothetical protein
MNPASLAIPKEVSTLFSILKVSIQITGNMVNDVDK